MTTISTTFRRATIAARLLGVISFTSLLVNSFFCQLEDSVGNNSLHDLALKNYYEKAL